MSETNDVAGALPEHPHTSDTTTEAAALVIESEPQATAGQMLREARLVSGMHIGTLSLALKVPVKKLEALEADDWAHLPDAVFVRALATSVCRQIKADSAPILAALPQSKNFLDIDEGSKIAIQPSFHSPSDSKWRKLSLRLSMPMIAGALALLLAALLLIFLPDFAIEQAKKKTEVIEKIEPVIAVSKPVVVVVEPVTVASAVIATPLATSASAALPIKSIVPAPVSSAVSLAKAAPSAPVLMASPPVPALPAGASILRLVAKGEVWVQVKDSKGAVLVQRNLRPKEIVNVSGAPPLSVVLGRVNQIESVIVRGKPFDFVAVSAENIARFEVK